MQEKDKRKSSHSATSFFKKNVVSPLSRKHKLAEGDIKEDAPQKRQKKCNEDIMKLDGSSGVSSEKCQLKLISEDFPKIKKTPHKIAKYDIRKTKDIQKLVKNHGQNLFEYDKKANKDITKAKLYLAPVAVLGGELGVFAGEEIKKSSTMIGRYVGDPWKTEEEEDENSRYVFKIIDESGEIIEIIDSAKKRDWTAFLNHGQTPNISVKQELIDGKYHICFYVVHNINKDEQLIFDYGKDYFKKTKFEFTPFYLHPTENWLTPSDKLTPKILKDYYTKGIYAFDEKTCKDLNLSSANQWLIPKVFLAIYENDIETLQKLLESGCPVDLFAYSYDKGEIKVTEQQELTPLMFACYLCREDCIDLLLHHGADVNRCMLIAGYTPLTLLLLGYGTQEAKDGIGTKLLDYMPWPFITDKYDYTVLHYAVMNEAYRVVSRLLTIAKNEKENFLTRENRRLGNADLDYCFRHNNFKMLEILLKFSSDEQAIKLVETSTSFNTDYLKTMRPDILQQLMTVLSNHSLASHTSFSSKIAEISNLLETNSTEETLITRPNRNKEEVVTKKKTKERSAILLNNILRLSVIENNFDTRELDALDGSVYFIANIKRSTGNNTINYKSALEFTLVTGHNGMAKLIAEKMSEYIQKINADERETLLANFDPVLCLRLTYNDSPEIFSLIMSFYQHDFASSRPIAHLLAQMVDQMSDRLDDEIKIFKKIVESISVSSNIAITGKEYTNLSVAILNWYIAKTQSNKEDQRILESARTMIYCLKLIPIVDPSHNKLLKTIINRDDIPIDLLLAFIKGTDINTQDEKGMTPLMYAIRKGEFKKIKLLLNNGADPRKSIQYKYKKKLEDTTPLEYAENIYAQYKIIELLKKYCKLKTSTLIGNSSIFIDLTKSIKTSHIDITNEEGMKLN